MVSLVREYVRLARGGRGHVRILDAICDAQLHQLAKRDVQDVRGRVPVRKMVSERIT